MADQTEKPKLGTRPPLGLKRTVETGKVKQSFSHGRSNTVVVEVKKRRILGRPGEAPPAAPEPAPVAEAPKPAPKPAAPAPAARKPSPQDDITSRKELQTKLLREAEESRLASLEEARRREERVRSAQSEDERRRADENRKAEEAAAEEARLKAEEEARRAAEAPAEPDTAVPVLDDEVERTARRPGAHAPAPRRPEPARPSRGRGDDHRQRGKLTVTRALSDEDDSRARSLAALRRAREKEKRHHMEAGPSAKQVRDVVVPEAITVQDLANRMAERGADLVKALFKMGSPVTLTQTIDQDTAELLVTEFGHRIKRVSEADIDIDSSADVDAPESLKPRPPVVTIMGHVDHGKTSLLDAIRGADVVSGEAGGITQHIGAYQVTLKDKSKVTFLDTPGHEAFTEMRARGANVTDIVVLVVAADDGVMPQTLEAIDHAHAAEVPIIVAVNKIDKPGALPERVKKQLADRGLVPEDWGGKTVFVDVSAKQKTNLNLLMEMICLVADLQDLKALADRPATGVVLEAKLDRGRGPVATVLVQNGTLRTGGNFVVGNVYGKVRAMFDDRGNQLQEAPPSTPVEILGMEGLPQAGDQFLVVADRDKARGISDYREQKAREAQLAKSSRVSLEGLAEQMKSSGVKELNIILKGDVQGSVEVLSDLLSKMSNDQVRLKVLRSGVGAITESDVLLASASNAIIIGFNVRPERKAQELAEQEKVDIRLHSIIYELQDEIKRAMSGLLEPTIKETHQGRAQVLETFRIPKVGTVAGCRVLDGLIKRDSEVRLLRDNVVIYKGKVGSLRRFKDDASEVRNGMECGISIAGYGDVKVGDVIEAFITERVAAEVMA